MMKNKDIIVAINAMNKIIGKEDVKIAYEIRRAIRKNHPVFMEEYEIMNEERKRLASSTSDVKVEELSVEEYNEFNIKKKAVEQEIMNLLEKEVDIEVVKVSESFLRESELSLAEEMALEFMLEPDEMGGEM